MPASQLLDPFERAVRRALHDLVGPAALSILSSEFGDRLESIYRAAFPKKCGTCGRVYETQAAWEQAEGVGAGASRLWDSCTNLLHDYRDCQCGSTLLVVLEDRRLATEVGVARRELFVDCVDRVVTQSGAPRPLVEERVRRMFRETALPVPPQTRERLTARDVQELLTQRTSASGSSGGSTAPTTNELQQKKESTP